MASTPPIGASLREQRTAARLTQAELAELAGVPQPNISAYELGRRTPGRETIERLERALRTPRLARIESVRDQLLEAAARRGLSDIRVFGSVVRGEADATSDIDLLVHPGRETSLFDLAGFMIEAESLLGSRVDIISDRSGGPVLERILAEAIPL